MKKENTQRNKNPLLVLNASPKGAKGNAAHFLKTHWPKNVHSEVIHLVNVRKDKKLFKKVLEAPAVVFVTGTYWDSWGSPLQEFFEAFTDYEGHTKLVGKPAACLVLMHSVGGKGILSRLQGVINTFGFLIPPMSGMVYSLVNKLSAKTKSSHADDFWQPQDLVAIIDNLQAAIEMSQLTNWKAWPVDKKDPRRLWMKEK